MSTANAFHALDGAETLNKLHTRIKGLSQAEVQRRLEQYGPNEIEAKEKPSKLALLWAQIKNPLVAILLAAAVISFIAGKNRCGCHPGGHRL